MNIAFGQAAAELAEVIDISVTLSFPKLNIVKVCDLLTHISNDVHYVNKCNLVEQRFNGKAGGVAYLIFPPDTEKEFVSMFHMDEDDNDHEVFIDVEREVLSEVGNILIGACISKIFDLLKTSVTYAPPHTMIGHKFEDHLLKGCFTGDDYAIMLNTGFSLSEKKP